MRIIDRFSSEHEEFVKELDALQLAVRAGGDPAAATARMRTLAGPLLKHAANEEVLLFPDLVEILGGAAGGMVAVLRQEHSLLHRQVDTLTAEPDRAEFDRAFRAFDSLLRAHIEKEEAVLFPLSARLLGDERLAEMDGEVVAAI